MIDFSIALPHYDGLFPDSGIAGAERTRAALAYAQHAEQLGLSQLWVSDHRWLDLSGRRHHSADCWALLAAIAARTTRIRLGSLVTNAALRDPVLLAHQVATVADISGPRLDVGLGAGWQASEFTRYPSAADRLTALERAAEQVRLLTSGSVPIWFGGKRRGILEGAARIADGWNLAWDPTASSHARRLEFVQTGMRAAGREPSDMTLSVGLTTLIGEDDADLQWRWERLRHWAPGDYLANADLPTWRQRRLVGAPGDIRRQVAGWEQVGVTHVVCALGMPFGLVDDEQLRLLAEVVALPRNMDSGRRP